MGLKIGIFNYFKVFKLKSDKSTNFLCESQTCLPQEKNCRLKHKFCRHKDKFCRLKHKFCRLLHIICLNSTINLQIILTVQKCSHKLYKNL